MPEEHEQHSPEILKQIQAVERKVERMRRAAEQEASSVLENARTQAQALQAEKQKALQAKTRHLLAEGIQAAEREATRITLEAKVKASDLKARAMTKQDEAVEFVLRRILPAVSGQQSARI